MHIQPAGTGSGGTVSSGARRGRKSDLGGHGLEQQGVDTGGLVVEIVGAEVVVVGADMSGDSGITAGTIAGGTREGEVSKMRIAGGGSGGRGFVDETVRVGQGGCTGRGRAGVRAGMRLLGMGGVGCKVSCIPHLGRHGSGGEVCPLHSFGGSLLVHFLLFDIALIARALEGSFNSLVLTKRAWLLVVSGGSNLEITFCAETCLAAAGLIEDGVDEHADGTFLTSIRRRIVETRVAGG